MTISASCELALQHGIRAVLVGRHDERVAVRLQVISQSKFARDAAEQRARFEIDRLRA